MLRDKLYSDATVTLGGKKLGAHNFMLWVRYKLKNLQRLPVIFSPF
jgi:hypothetical protein